MAAKIPLIACLLSLLSSLATASETLTDEPDGHSYNFVSHYSIEINAPATTVWKHLTDLGSWMYDFGMKPTPGFNELSVISMPPVLVILVPFGAPPSNCAPFAFQFLTQFQASSRWSAENISISPFIRNAENLMEALTQSGAPTSAIFSKSARLRCRRRSARTFCSPGG